MDENTGNGEAFYKDEEDNEEMKGDPLEEEERGRWQE